MIEVGTTKNNDTPVEQRRKLVESEHKRMVIDKQVVMVEQMMAGYTALGLAMREELLASPELAPGVGLKLLGRVQHRIELLANGTE